MAAKTSAPSSKDQSVSPELSQRVAVLKRFKELLKAQRDRFRTYLDVLDKQKDVIQGKTTEDLMGHVELEEQILADIFSIQKVIDPLEEMYRSVRPEAPMENGTFIEGNEISGLKEVLEGLKNEAILRSEQNKDLLAGRMAQVRSEIKTLRSSTFARRRSDSTIAPSHIDISG